MISIARTIAGLLFAATSVSAQNPALEAQRAQQAMADEKFSQAIDIYAHLSGAFPQNLDIKRNLALALHSAKRYSEALHYFGEILERVPGDRASLLFSGIELTLIHRPADAIPVLTRFLSQDSQNSIALVARGGAYLALEDFNRAVDDFSKAAELDSQNVQAWEGLGKAYLMGAQRAFQRIEEKNAFSAEWYALAARSSLSAKDYKRAFELFREAAARSMDLPGVHAGLAEVYRATNHDEWASIEEGKEKHASLDAATELRRNYLEALTFQQRSGEVLDRLGRNPDSPAYHALLGLADRIQGRDVGAADEFRRALAFSPDNITLKLELATSLWLANDCNSAMPVLRDLLRGDPNSPETKHVLGECLVNENHPRDAIPLLQDALRKDPRLLPAESALGRAYLHSGDYSDAVLHLRKAVSLGDPAVLVQLASAYRHLGDERQSAECLNQYKQRSAHAPQDGEKIVSREITPP